MNGMQEQLNTYYERDRISPVENTGNFDNMFNEFGCPMKENCRAAVLNGAEFSVFEPRTEGVYVSKYYEEGNYNGDRIPRIVVISLSAPRPDISTAENETCSQTERVQNYHWPETLMTVRSLLCPSISPEKFPEPELLEELFVHLRTAKCCSNAEGGNQEPPQVYENCGRYLDEEVRILKPEVIVTQGNYAHWQAEKHVFKEKVENIAVEEVDGIDDLIARIMNLTEDNLSIYWLRAIFPTPKWGHMRRWHEQAGPEIRVEGIRGVIRENLVLYGEKIKKYLQSGELGSAD